MGNDNEKRNKFRIDLFGKKRIAALEQKLEDLTQKTGFINNRNKEYEGLPEIKISDGEFIKNVGFQFGLSHLKAKAIIDYIEKQIPKEIAGGKKALVWQDLGTFYAVERKGKWQPRVRFHQAFKVLLNKVATGS